MMRNIVIKNIRIFSKLIVWLLYLNVIKVALQMYLFSDIVTQLCIKIIYYAMITILDSSHLFVYEDFIVVLSFTMKLKESCEIS